MLSINLLFSSCTLWWWRNSPHERKESWSLLPNVEIHSYRFIDISYRGLCKRKPSKRKWIEMDRNGFVLFKSNPDSDFL